MTDEDPGRTRSSAGDARANAEEPRQRTDASNGDDAATRDRARTHLRRVRTQPRAHRLALAATVVVGLALAWIHWLGLLVGGALVGFVAPTVRRALLAGVGFGLVVLVVFAVTLGSSVGKALAMAPASYLAIGAALGLPVFGSLFRGLG